MPVGTISSKVGQMSKQLKRAPLPRTAHFNDWLSIDHPCDARGQEAALILTPTLRNFDINWRPARYDWRSTLAWLRGVKHKTQSAVDGV